MDYCNIDQNQDFYINVINEIKYKFITKAPIDIHIYLPHIKKLNTFSIDIIINSTENVDELQLISNQINFNKTLPSSTYYCFINRWLFFERFNKSQDIFLKLCYYDIPLSNRHFEPFLEYVYKDTHNTHLDFIESLFELIISKNIIVSSNLVIKFIIYFKKYNPYILLNNIKFFTNNFDSNSIDDKYLAFFHLDNDRISELKLLDLSSSQKNTIAQKIVSTNSVFSHFKQFITNSTYNIVIDGANLGYYRNTYPLNQKYIDNCYKYYKNKGYNPLIIIHNRHKNNYHLMRNWIDNKSVYFTGNGLNDDNFWLLAAITANMIIVTNDNIKDHINSIIGNTSNRTTFFDIFRTKYIQNYDINSLGQFIPEPKQCYNYTLYKFKDKTIGFPNNDNFYIV